MGVGGGGAFLFGGHGFGCSRRFFSPPHTEHSGILLFLFPKCRKRSGIKEGKASIHCRRLAGPTALTRKLRLRYCCHLFSKMLSGGGSGKDRPGGGTAIRPDCSGSPDKRTGGHMSLGHWGGPRTGE